MPIKHLDHTHNTAKEARTCWEKSPANVNRESASKKQLKLIQELSAERVLNKQTLPFTFALFGQATFQPDKLSLYNARLLIDEMLAAPRKDPAASTPTIKMGTATLPPPYYMDPNYTNKVNNLLRSVPDGRYAVNLGVTPNAEDKLRFFHVRRTKTHQGTRQRVTISEQAGPNIHVVSYPKWAPVLAAIAENPLAALTRYGKELNHCGVCGLELTDPISRAIGMGPKCRAKRLGA